MPSNILVSQALNATRVTASKLDERVKELLKENTVVSGKSGFWEEFEVCLAFLQFSHLF